MATKWATLLDDLKADRGGIVMGGVSINLVRQARAFCSAPAPTAGKAAIARCRDRAKSGTLAGIDRPGVRVPVNPGGISESFARASSKPATVVPFPTHAGIFDESDADRPGGELLHQELNPKRCAVNLSAELGHMPPHGDSVFEAHVDQWLRLRQKIRQMSEGLR